MQKSKYPRVLGTYPILLFKVRVNVDSDSGGHFVGWEKDCPEITVGVDLPWRDVVDVATHELGELYMAMRGFRYCQDPMVSQDQTGLLFVITHPQMSEVFRFVAHGMCEISDDLHKAYVLFGKEHR